MGVEFDMSIDKREQRVQRIVAEMFQSFSVIE
jgi:hypothetical protein